MDIPVNQTELCFSNTFINIYCINFFVSFSPIVMKFRVINFSLQEYWIELVCDVVRSTPSAY